MLVVLLISTIQILWIKCNVALRLRAQLQLFATFNFAVTVILSCVSARSLSGFLSVVPTSLQWQFIPAHHIIETIKSLIDFKCPDLLCVDGEVFRAALSSPSHHCHWSSPSTGAPKLEFITWTWRAEEQTGTGYCQIYLDITIAFGLSLLTTVVLIHYELEILNTQICKIEKIYIDICYLSTNIYGYIYRNT